MHAAACWSKTFRGYKNCKNRGGKVQHGGIPSARARATQGQGSKWSRRSRAALAERSLQPQEMALKLPSAMLAQPRATLGTTSLLAWDLGKARSKHTRPNLWRVMEGDSHPEPSSNPTDPWGMWYSNGAQLNSSVGVNFHLYA